jgi:hypothetical protein
MSRGEEEVEGEVGRWEGVNWHVVISFAPSAASLARLATSVAWSAASLARLATSVAWSATSIVMSAVSVAGWAGSASAASG